MGCTIFNRNCAIDQWNHPSPLQPGSYTPRDSFPFNEAVLNNTWYCNLSRADTGTQVGED